MASQNGHSSNGYQEILSPLEGTFYLTKESNEKAVQVGDVVKEGDIVGYIESMKVINAVAADKSGKVVEICVQNAAAVEEDDVLIKIN